MDSLRLRNSLGWAPATPLICALHCVLTPFLLALAPGLSVLAALEGPLLAASAIVCTLTLRSGIRAHRQIAVVGPAAAGLTVWAASLSGALAPVPEPPTTVIGSLVVAGAMVWNVRLRHRAAREACACPTC